MKIKMYVILFAVLLTAKISKAQSGNAKLLIGKWNVESLSPVFPANATAKQKEKGQQIIAEDTKSYKETGFTFLAGGKLSVEKKDFIWKMSADGITVTVFKGKKSIAVATIKELTDHKLVFSRPDEGMIVTYVLMR